MNKNRKQTCCFQISHRFLGKSAISSIIQIEAKYYCIRLPRIRIIVDQYAPECHSRQPKHEHKFLFSSRLMTISGWKLKSSHFSAIISFRRPHSWDGGVKKGNRGAGKNRSSLCEKEDDVIIDAEQ
jgi:hypothetical protein